MAFTKYNIRINIDTKMYFIFHIRGKSQFGNYLLAVEKYYIYKNKFSDKQLNIDSFISIFKVKFQCKNNKMSDFH